MPIKKSAFKELRKIKKRTIANEHVHAFIRKDVKAARRAIAENVADVAALVNVARKTLAKAAQKGVIHRNKAARLMSRLEKKVRSINRSSPRGGSAFG